MSDRQWTGSVSVLPQAMRLLAEQFATKGYERHQAQTGTERQLREYLADNAYTLAEWADAVEQLYARLDEGEVPTNAQGVALARFLRHQFRDDVDPGERHAHVSRGGMGLPDDYIAVRLADGYVGGIDRDGRVST